MGVVDRYLLDKALARNKRLDDSAGEVARRLKEIAAPLRWRLTSQRVQQ